MTLQERLNHKIITAVMTAQILNNQLHDLVVLGVFNKSLKMHVRNSIKALESVEHNHYDRFFSNKGDTTAEVYDVYEKFIAEMAKVPIYHCENIIEMYDKFRRDIQTGE